MGFGIILRFEDFHTVGNNENLRDLLKIKVKREGQDLWIILTTLLHTLSEEGALRLFSCFTILLTKEASTVVGGVIDESIEKEDSGVSEMFGKK